MPGPNPANICIGLADKLSKTRKLRELTQDALAHKAGISTQLVSMLERGQVKDPHIGAMIALARVLGVSVESLCEHQDGERPLC
jgi:transcriptional regulator with XRE-family HTH domain